MPSQPGMPPLSHTQLQIDTALQEFQLVDLSRRFLTHGSFWSLPQQFLGNKVRPGCLRAGGAERAPVLQARLCSVAATLAGSGADAALGGGGTCPGTAPGSSSSCRAGSLPTTLTQPWERAGTLSSREPPLTTVSHTQAA